jgi:hypothetical protein
VRLHSVSTEKSIVNMNAELTHSGIAEDREDLTDYDLDELPSAKLMYDMWNTSKDQKFSGYGTSGLKRSICLWAFLTYKSPLSSPCNSHRSSGRRPSMPPSLESSKLYAKRTVESKNRLMQLFTQVRKDLFELCLLEDVETVLEGG